MFRHAWFRMMAAVTGLLDEHSRQVVAYLKEENRVLRKQLQHRCGCRRVQLTDARRRRLAVKGQGIGRYLLADVADLFSPETLLKWYRQLVAAKYDGSPNRKGGRPKLS